MANSQGGYTKFLPAGEEMSVYDASIKYKEAKIPLIVLAGKEYSIEFFRDWAAKGIFLMGIKAVILKKQ